MSSPVLPGTYITFRQRSEWRNHWIRLNTDDVDFAQKWAEQNWPNDYSMVYSQAQFSSQYFPAGEKEYIEQPKLVG
ncbi:hypothetical protein [Nodosilinea nodulosa]|uniref:hypothetical protein n=1 Tax=Nodosilinea nodulosa TaxID=416001 RepID=UPI0012D7A607|nr:hypothetical protein [Nodosilinea nodulosa]